MSDLKVLHQSLSKHPGYVKQFIHEAKAVGRINHPHVVHAIDAGQEDGYNYFAMEYVDGETLRHRLKRLGKLPEKEILDIARSVTQGLANAHDSGLLHRDLKPDNIMIGSSGVVKITDLGLAMLLDDVEVAAEEHRRMGTPFYMSPEQAEGKEIDGRSDLYALGCTLYHAMVGKPPFTGSSVSEILKKHLHQDVAPPRQVGAEVSEATEQLVMKLLAKDPANRCANARAVLALIEKAEEQLKAPPPPKALKAPTSRRPSPRKAGTAKTAPSSRTIGSTYRLLPDEIARSGSPSASRSSISENRGNGLGRQVCGVNVPSPAPSSTDTSPRPVFTVTRSQLASPSRSAATTADGNRPTSNDAPPPKRAAPVPKSNDTSSLLALAVARSGRPSPSRSPTAIARGKSPTEYDASSAKKATPLLSRTDTSSVDRLAAARSRSPS